MTASPTITIKPGLLVSLKCPIAGGTSYRQLQLDHAADGARDIARWETERTIEDADEHARAVKVRTTIRTAITRLCASTDFGLICPPSRAADLDAAVIAGRRLAAEFNAGARFDQISVRVIKGRIASTDEESARAIADEIGSLLGAINAGIDKLDPKAIREAAAKARELEALLGDAEAAKVGAAVEAARVAAREITRRVGKKGEEAATVLADIQRGAIESARIAFLDFVPVVREVEALPAVVVQRFADLDLSDDAPVVLTSSRFDAAPLYFVVDSEEVL